MRRAHGGLVLLCVAELTKLRVVFVVKVHNFDERLFKSCLVKFESNDVTWLQTQNTFSSSKEQYHRE